MGIDMLVQLECTLGPGLTVYVSNGRVSRIHVRDEDERNIFLPESALDQEASDALAALLSALTRHPAEKVIDTLKAL